MKTCILSIAFMAMASVASGQALVGKALVDGKEVELFSDKSWRYVVEPAADCKTVTPKLQFCGDPARWKASPPPSPVVVAAYMFNSATYGQFVIEDVGAAQGLTLETARRFVIQTAEVTARSTATIIDVRDGEFDGQPSETLIYHLKVSGLDVVFADTFVLRENTLAQIITYEIASDFTDAHTKAHAEFVAATRIKE